MRLAFLPKPHATSGRAPTGRSSFSCNAGYDLVWNSDKSLETVRAGKKSGGLAARSLASAPVRPVSRQRTWPQPKLRAQRRGHVVQMLAAVAAIFFRRIVGAQPVSPSLAFRIDALHGPSWQIAHAASLAFKSTAPKLGDRILRPENCGVKAKGTIYRGLFADLWKSATERQMLNQRRGYRPRVTRLQISSRASGTPARGS